MGVLMSNLKNFEDKLNFKRGTRSFWNKIGNLHVFLSNSNPEIEWRVGAIFSCWLSVGLTWTSKCILVYKGVLCRGCDERQDERMRKYIAHMAIGSGFHFQSSKTRPLHTIIIQTVILLSANHHLQTLISIQRRTVEGGLFTWLTVSRLV